MPYSDPKRQKEAQRQHYLNNKTAYLSRAAVRRREIVEWFGEYKSQFKCTRCPEDDPICLDFHHPDPNEKDRGVSELMDTMSKSRIMAEIAKCIVLCSNCHRKEHHRLRIGRGGED